MGETRDYAGVAHDYAAGVVAGRVDACKWVRLACQRHLDDLERWSGSGPWVFSPARAARPCLFLEGLPHVKGEWANRREKIRLEPWQIFILASVFGWLDREALARGMFLRRFRLAYIEVPRKNGKSAVSAGVGLYGLTADEEEGAEVYSAATTRDQAKVVWSMAHRMAKKEPEFRDAFGVDIRAHSILCEHTGSFFHPLASDADSLEGLNSHVSIIDELHAHKSREVYDVLESSTGSRHQPLLWIITTAGSDRAGICYEVRGYITKILEGVAGEERAFGVIYTIDEGDDWTDPAVWAKANPNLGVSVSVQDIAAQARKAQQMPSAQNNFLTKRLNVWVNADTAWMNMLAWDRCRDAALSLDDFAGSPCWAGLDLASKTDIAALVLLFPHERDGRKRYAAFGRYYLPEETAESSANSQYSGWARSGYLTTTEGNVIDFGRIEEDLREDASRFEIREVAYDPFQATQFSTRMLAEGFPMVEMRPTVLNFSEPMKELEALVLDGRFRHDGSPVLAWMVSNVVCHRDAKDNIYPRKERPENKIDGVVALVMALGRAMAQAGPRRSVYETRGVLAV